MKIKVWVVHKNSGDGGCYTKLFNEESEAQKFYDGLSEPFTDEPQQMTIEVDSEGKIKD